MPNSYQNEDQSSNGSKSILQQVKPYGIIKALKMFKDKSQNTYELFSVNTKQGLNFIMITNNEIIALDSEMNKCNEGENKIAINRNLMAIDMNERTIIVLKGKELIRIDINLLCENQISFEESKVFKYSDKKLDGLDSLLTFNEHHICIVNSRSGNLMKYLNSDRLKLEDVDFCNQYLAWKQVKNIFMAVDRFNVVSYWNTLTGKLFHKEKLKG